MSRPRLGRHHAVFPPGYSARGPVWNFLWLLARSRRIRAFGFALPHSRLRSALVASYYHRAFESWGKGDLSWVDAFSDEAPVTVLQLETYSGQEGVRQALTEWSDLVAATPEMIEFINPPGDRVLLVVHGSGRGSFSGVELQEELAYAVVRVQGGEGVSLDVLRTRTEALAAVGLSDRQVGTLVDVTK